MWKNAWDENFITLMRNRIKISDAKYGDLKKTKSNVLTNNRDELKNALYRIDLYKKSGNTEYLVDAANFLMFEFMEMHGKFLFTDNDKNSKIV